MHAQSVTEILMLGLTTPVVDENNEYNSSTSTEYGENNQISTKFATLIGKEMNYVKKYNNANVLSQSS